jgi:hypothetical protein
VDGQRARDGRAAVDELVGGVDDSFAFVGFERGPGVFEEVEVAGVAFGAFVYDLGKGGVSSGFFTLILILIFDWIVFFFLPLQQSICRRGRL